MYPEDSEASARAETFQQPHKQLQPTEESHGLHVVGDDGVQDASRARRQDFSQEKVSRKETKLGEYILGQTLGEGEFGKVKMGWRKTGGAQVAVKIIRREKLDNQSRLAKVYREINILRELDHPNIVRLHEMVETDKTIGIILDYASGGELFDFILKHRFLHDPLARRLFAQLVSGVGYLHKKGIIHRDLKLENLLLDRNENVIITDFGFANKFDPTDELGDKVESRLYDRGFVKKMNLEAVQKNGFRRGDLMATSCGSPCYAAPELVVSDGIYTGRKVDVWSCGVILYAMLAGYLPYDDDPANPEGDNINLLYKYIVTTPLVFPEHVTPHARDLLRRILVPDPRSRADLFEVARHSWLTEYAHVVEFITSGTTTTTDIDHAAINTDGQYGVPSLARSASVREPVKPHRVISPVGGLTSKHGNIDPTAESDKQKPVRDTKRRTVQVEYVAPQSQTIRGEPQPSTFDSPETHRVSPIDSPRSRLKNGVPGGATAAGAHGGIIAAGAQGGVATAGPFADDGRRIVSAPSDGPFPPSKDYYSAPPSRTNLPPTRSDRDAQRVLSDTTARPNRQNDRVTRPNLGGSTNGSSRLPSRGSYGQPVAAAVATTSVQGRFAQPKTTGSKQYVISNPITQTDMNGSLNAQQDYQHQSSLHVPNRQPRNHQRSTTLGGLGEKIFGDSGTHTRRGGEQRQKTDRAYPPTSMRPVDTESSPRKSTDSRRSFGFSRRSSDLANKEKRSSRRFSILSRFSSGQKDESSPQPHEFYDDSRPSTGRQHDGSTMTSGRNVGQTTSQTISHNNAQSQRFYDGGDENTAKYSSRTSQTTAAATAPTRRQQPNYSSPNFYSVQQERESRQPQYSSKLKSNEDSFRNGRSEPLQRDNRRFADSYDQGTGQHGGSSGAARKVMDFFRRKGKARGE